MIYYEQIGRSFDFIISLKTATIFTEEQKRIFIPTKIFVPLWLIESTDIFPKEEFKAINRELEYLNVVYKKIWKFSGETFITIEVSKFNRDQTKEQTWEEIKKDFEVFRKKFKNEFANRRSYFLSQVKKQQELNI